VLIGPLPRYLYSACCRDKENVTNIHRDDYRTKMRSECDAARQKIRNSVWINKLGRVSTINPGRAIRKFCDQTSINENLVWEDDPVHLSSDGYRAIANEIVKSALWASYDRQL
jgi:lysophospholipase L1-like esterase